MFQGFENCKDANFHGLKIIRPTKPANTAGFFLPIVCLIFFIPEKSLNLVTFKKSHKLIVLVMPKNLFTDLQL